MHGQQNSLPLVAQPPLLRATHELIVSGIATRRLDTRRARAALLRARELPLNPDGTIPDWTILTARPNLRVLDPSGRAGTLEAPLSAFTLVPASSKDPVIQEFALVASVSVEPRPYPRTRIHLSAELENCYDRTATTVNANVGLATQGMSVTEILGSGQAYTPNQKFSLKQTPLTFVQAPTATGRLSTLEVRANSVVWKEQASLYQQVGSAQHRGRVSAEPARTGHDRRRGEPT